MVANLAAVSDGSPRQRSFERNRRPTGAQCDRDTGKYLAGNGGPAVFARSAGLKRVGGKLRGMHGTAIRTGDRSEPTGGGT